MKSLSIGTILVFYVTTCFGQSDGDIGTKGGNAGGARCVFPFKYQDRMYTDCTDTNANNIWCATTSDYEADKAWGYCLKDVGKHCVLPFIYQGISYPSCQPYGDGKWCSITGNYDTDSKWQYCADDTPSCETEPCLNGGKCTKGSSWDGCVCPDGFMGPKCQYEAIETIGGTAREGSLCMFPFNYKGQIYKKCITIDSGVDGDSWCYADSPGLWGYCAEDICEPETCKHGGECKLDTTRSTGYTCECAAGFRGENCEKDLDECIYVLCMNGGICHQNAPGQGYRCECKDGYTGKHCEKAEDICKPETCKHGGECKVDETRSTGYTCECAAGFRGENCEKVFNPCEGIVCQNGGSCKQRGLEYVCQCPKDHIGAHCEIEVLNDCEGVVCSNGGTCVQIFNGGYKCRCTDDYKGPHCETPVANPCEGIVCQNGGSCKQHGLGYRCHCPYNYIGAVCQIELHNDCEGVVCSNGGTCVQLFNGDRYKCRCTDDYKGPHCETPDKDLCSGSTKCLNGGACKLNNNNEYYCLCQIGFTGRLCEMPPHTDCDCDYHSGGCSISKYAPPGKACECKYKGFWTCGGEVTKCKDPKSKYCINPDMSWNSCLQGGGDCEGY